MDALLLLRKCYQDKTPVFLRGEWLILGPTKIPRDLPTPYRSEKGTGKFYTLSQLWFFLEHHKLTHGQYVRQCVSQGINSVSLPDKKDLLEYLQGYVDHSPYIDLVNVPLVSAPDEPDQKRQKTTDGNGQVPAPLATEERERIRLAIAGALRASPVQAVTKPADAVQPSAMRDAPGPAAHAPAAVEGAPASDVAAAAAPGTENGAHRSLVDDAGKGAPGIDPNQLMPPKEDIEALVRNDMANIDAIEAAELTGSTRSSVLLAPNGKDLSRVLDIVKGVLNIVKRQPPADGHGRGAGSQQAGRRPPPPPPGKPGDPLGRSIRPPGRSEAGGRAGSRPDGPRHDGRRDESRRRPDDRGSGKARAKSQPPKAPGGSSKRPFIIVVPGGITSLINMWNVKEFLEEGRWATCRRSAPCGGVVTDVRTGPSPAPPLFRAGLWRRRTRRGIPAPAKRRGTPSSTASATAII